MTCESKLAIFRFVAHISSSCVYVFRLVFFFFWRLYSLKFTIRIFELPVFCTCVLFLVSESRRGDGKQREQNRLLLIAMLMDLFHFGFGIG